MTERTPEVKPLQLVTMEELAAMGWREGRHTARIGPSGAGKTPAGDFWGPGNFAAPREELLLLTLRPQPQPPEAA